MIATLRRRPATEAASEPKYKGPSLKAKLEPTAAAGMPYQPPAPAPGPSLRIPESVTAYGDQTGKPYFRYGDRADGQPETVSVSPSPGAGITTAIPGGHGAVAMDNGGTAIVGGDPANDPNSAWYQQPGATMSPAPVQQVDPLAAQLAAKRNVYDAQTSLDNSKQAGLMSTAGVLGATAGTFAPQANVNYANRGVIAAEGNQTNARVGYIQQQQADTAQTQQENAGIIAASQNVADKTAVAQAQNSRNNSDYLYGLAGEQKPVEIDTPNGADDASLPPGVRARLQTQEEIKTTSAKNAEATRSLSLKASQEIVDLLGTSVDKARQLADSYGIDLADAKLNVAKAQNAQGYTTLGTDQAGINLSRANTAAGLTALPDKAGDVIYTDPYTATSSYMTPNDAAQAKHDNDQLFGITNAQSDANYAAGLQPAKTAAQTAQDLQYINNPNDASTPIAWILQNMTTSRLDAGGSVYTNPGVLTRQQAIAALVAHGYTLAQAQDLTQPSQTVSGSGGGSSTGGGSPANGSGTQGSQVPGRPSLRP